MQNIAIISSSQDQAGVNIRNNLLESYQFENAKIVFEGKEIDMKFDGHDVFRYSGIREKFIDIYLINHDLIHAENIDKIIQADIFIFASKHRSKENTKSFAVHPIGNWSNAEFGGKEKELCFSSASLLKNMFVELNNVAKNSGHELTMEATHHGPYTEHPSVFAEIGSTENEWNDKENGRLMAKTIMNSLNNQNQNNKIAVGIGGPHYCNNFNKIALRTDIAFSHFCPKYHLGKLDEGLVRQAIAKTSEKVDFFVLDWKGLGAEKQRIVEMLGSLSLEFRRTDRILRD